METIYNHDNEVDIAHKINTMELDNWINHLKYIEKELRNLINLSDQELYAKIDNENILNRFQKKEVENNTLLSVLYKYRSTREKIVECEDTDCDMVFISEHENLRRSYVYHLEKYRRIKDLFYGELYKNITVLKRAVNY